MKLIRIILMFVVHLNVSLTAGQRRMFKNGSEVAERGQYPYLAYLRSNVFFCGAAILNEEYLLTAGHCAPKNGEIYVEAGVTNLYGGEEDTIQMRSSEYFIHENFSLPAAVYDIAVIKLPEKLNYTKYIQPIKLPKRNSGDFSGEFVNLAGYGVLNNRNKNEYKVRNSNFTVMTLEECMEYKKYFIETLNEQNLCAVGVSATESACAGSPLVLPDQNTVIGITSYIKDDEDFNDCEQGFPTVFTRVTSYLDWISEKTGIEIDE